MARPRRSVASSVFVQDERKPTAASPVPFFPYQIVNGSFFLSTIVSAQRVNISQRIKCLKAEAKIK